MSQLTHAVEIAETAATAARPSAVPVVAAMVTLAGLDLLGTALAKHWAEHRSLIAFGGGVLVFGLLFVVYGRSLDYAEMTTVTLGWIVLLQVGVIIIERMDGVAIPPQKLGIMVAILLLQGWLTLGDLRA